MSFWAPERSSGCFVYFMNEQVPARELMEAVLSALDVPDLQLSTKNYKLRWSKFSWKKFDAAYASSESVAVKFYVGTTQDVRLAGAIWLRQTPGFDDRFASPPVAWVAAESTRWPEAVFVKLARRWLRIGARAGTSFSGGILGAADLRNAKVEITKEFETFPDEIHDTSPTSFRERMFQERPLTDVRDLLRRVYPTTLLGPKLAQQVDVSQLAAAGATNIEQVSGSIIFDATPMLLEAWSQEYLATTVRLRRLLWPLSFQNPADDPDPPPPKPSKPPRRGRP